MRKKFLKGFFSLYTFIIIVVVILICFGKSFSFSSLYDYMLGIGFDNTLNSFRSYFGSFRYYVDNFNSWSDFIKIIGNGFMSLLTALYLPIDFIIKVVGYFFI